MPFFSSLLTCLSLPLLFFFCSDGETHKLWSEKSSLTSPSSEFYFTLCKTSSWLSIAVSHLCAATDALSFTPLIFIWESEQQQPWSWSSSVYILWKECRAHQCIERHPSIVDSVIREITRYNFAFLSLSSRCAIQHRNNNTIIQWMFD